MAGLVSRGLISKFSKLVLNTSPIIRNYQPQNVNVITTLLLPRQIHNNTFLNNRTQPLQEVVEENTSQDLEITKDVIEKVNSQIAKKEEGRLFAVVHVAGKQFKITAGDIIIVEGYWPPNISDELTLDKILMIGSSDFSLVGRPMLENGLAEVKATVIEKTLSHTKTHFRRRKRKQYMRINFYRVQQTMLRINSIEVTGEVNNPKSIEGLDGRVF